MSTQHHKRETMPEAERTGSRRFWAGRKVTRRSLLAPLDVVLAGNPAGLAIIKPVSAQPDILETLTEAAELIACTLLFHRIALLAGET